jgi:hypothetical protein
MDEDAPGQAEQLRRTPAGVTLTGYTETLRAMAEGLDNLAWSLSIPEVGRTLSSFAHHLVGDAHRLEVLSMMVPALEQLPLDKKEEIHRRYEAHDREQRASDV